MTNPRRLVHIAATQDGLEMAESIRKRLGAEAEVRIATGMPESQQDRVQRDSGSGLPEPHENAVLVFMLTPLALLDLGFRAFARLAAASRFPMLPVPPQRGGFDFRALDEELTELGKLNAVAWDDGDSAGETVILAIRRYLGLEPFSRDCRLFISYRRSDGMEAAHAIYRHFRGIGFDAFLDTEDEAIEPGEPFQPRIHEAIPEKDFLLLVDSPDAADSGWVREEVSVALANRVSILVVRVAGSQGFPQVRDLPAFDWGTDPRRGLLDLERAVRSQLAARRTFDRRVQQILGHLSPLVPLTTKAIGRRRLLVTLGDGPDTRRCLLDYEDASYDLIRLHRLALGRAATGLTSPSDRAVLVHRGRGLSPEERTAVDWASHGEPLQVLSLDELAPFFLAAGPAT